MRILIVDDQPRTRASLKAVVNAWLHQNVVTEAADGNQALERVEAETPDVVLLDARMPGLDGIAVTRQIKSRWPRIKVIVLSMFPEYRPLALEAGADLFLSKTDPPEQLLAALKTAAGNLL